jgi:hypothetical protein
MNAFKRAVSQIQRGAVKSFQTFPAAIANALAFSLVTIVRIHLDWPEQEAYNFLFNCLHWSFAFGAIMSLAAITAAKSRIGDNKSFMTANLMGVLAAVSAFLLVYAFGGTDPEFTGMRYKTVSIIAASRVGVLMLVSFLTFIVMAGNPNDRSDFAHSYFMTHKAFFIALLYGIVIMSGTSAVAGAIRALLYREMSSKVYMYIGTLSGFLAFTIFLGYFPDFSKGNLDEHRAVAQKQPRFVEVLFQYIMVPIVLAMTVVLLLWAGKTIIGGMRANFFRLSSIATSFAVSGIWLHIMITHNETPIAKFYKKTYPVAVLFILAFEAWAFVLQLQKFGLKTTEYFFIVVWIAALLAAILLIVKKLNAHIGIVAVVCSLAIITVLPFVGYNELPINAQIERLENLLESQGMLEDGKLIAAKAEPEKNIRESITDAVSYLAGSNEANLPSWFERDLQNSNTFKSKMGFEQIWPQPDDFYEGSPGFYMSTSLYLKQMAVDVSNYNWAVSFQDNYEKTQNGAITIEGKKGTYDIYWTYTPPDNLPNLTIVLDGRTIIEDDMNTYIDKITEKYPPGNMESSQAVSIEDMSIKYETSEAEIMIVFRDLSISLDTREDRINYWINPDAMYIREK